MSAREGAVRYNDRRHHSGLFLNRDLGRPRIVHVAAGGAPDLVDDDQAARRPIAG